MSRAEVRARRAAEGAKQGRERSHASARLGLTLRSVLVAPRDGFQAALAAADRRARAGLRPAEGMAPVVLSAFGGAALALLWLKIGALLPKTGDLASAGPPMFAGALLAIREINEAGGVLGRPVTWIDGDDHTDKEKAKQTVERLINEDAHVIIGAGASSITLAVLPTVIAAGRILFSPCNTAAELSTVDDKGLYFRTAPPDNLQAVALTDVIMRDGVRRIVIVARDDAYGRGLMEAVRDNLRLAGIEETDISLMPYNPDDPDFSQLGEEIKKFDPNGVLLIGFDETAKAVDAMIKAGLKSRTV